MGRRWTGYTPRAYSPVCSRSSRPCCSNASGLSTGLKKNAGTSRLSLPSIQPSLAVYESSTSPAPPPTRWSCLRSTRRARPITSAEDRAFAVAVCGLAWRTSAHAARLGAGAQAAKRCSPHAARNRERQSKGCPSCRHKIVLQRPNPSLHRKTHSRLQRLRFPGQLFMTTSGVPWWSFARCRLTFAAPEPP